MGYNFGNDSDYSHHKQNLELKALYVPEEVQQPQNIVYFKGLLLSI